MRALGTASPMQRKPAHAKKGPTARDRARRRAKQLAAEIEIKALVKMRDGDVCRVCGRRAESVHEIKTKGAGGVVSLQNSISCCGLLVGVSPSCHTYLQSRELTIDNAPIDANLPFTVTPHSPAARKWLGLE